MRTLISPHHPTAAKALKPPRPSYNYGISRATGHLIMWPVAVATYISGYAWAFVTNHELYGYVDDYATDTVTNWGWAVGLVGLVAAVIIGFVVAGCTDTVTRLLQRRNDRRRRQTATNYRAEGVIVDLADALIARWRNAVREVGVDPDEPAADPQAHFELMRLAQTWHSRIDGRLTEDRQERVRQHIGMLFDQAAAGVRDQVAYQHSKAVEAATYDREQYNAHIDDLLRSEIVSPRLPIH